jgi:hypothetical protein
MKSDIEKQTGTVCRSNHIHFFVITFFKLYFCSLFSKAIGTGVVTTANRAKHTLPDLPYDYNALEPYIAADIMQLHHSKHHNTYVNNLNVAEEKLAEAVATSMYTL